MRALCLRWVLMWSGWTECPCALSQEGRSLWGSPWGWGFVELHPWWVTCCSRMIVFYSSRKMKRNVWLWRISFKHMSAFLLPESIGDEIQRMLNSFYWGSRQRNRRGINWMSWMLGCLDSLCGIKIQMKKFILFHLFK